MIVADYRFSACMVEKSGDPSGPAGICGDLSGPAGISGHLWGSVGICMSELTEADMHEHTECLS